MKSVVAAVLSAAAFVVFAPGAGEAQASCVAFDGRTSPDGKCTADAGSFAMVLGTASEAQAKGRGTVAVVIGNGSTANMTKGDNNFGLVIGQRSIATSALGSGEINGNRLTIIGNDSQIANFAGGGNNYTVRGNNNKITSTGGKGNTVTLEGTGNRFTVTDSVGRRGKIKGDNVRADFNVPTS